MNKGYKQGEITDKQITELYKFTRKHFVEHYDVQTELVDHLANDIEQIWLEKPKLSFKEARDLSFKKFGVFGFMEVVEQKQKELNKKYIKILWSFAKEWFRLPKVVLIFCLCLLFYYLLQFNVGMYITYLLFFSSALFAGLKLYKFKAKLKAKERKWMLEEMIFTQGGGSALIISTYPLHLFTGVFSGSYETVFMSVFLTATCIILYVSLIIMPQKAEELLAETYPEYKIL